jgi:hypothetical protein
MAPQSMTVPAWRVRFSDAENSTVYLDTVSGRVVGFVVDASRKWRWWRDAPHSLDFSWLNHRGCWSAGADVSPAPSGAALESNQLHWRM